MAPTVMTAPAPAATRLVLPRALSASASASPLDMPVHGGGKRIQHSQCSPGHLSACIQCVFCALGGWLHGVRRDLNSEVRMHVVQLHNQLASARATDDRLLHANAQLLRAPHLQQTKLPAAPAPHTQAASAGPFLVRAWMAAWGSQLRACGGRCPGWRAAARWFALLLHDECGSCPLQALCLT